MVSYAAYSKTWAAFSSTRAAVKPIYLTYSGNSFQKLQTSHQSALSVYDLEQQVYTASSQPPGTEDGSGADLRQGGMVEYLQDLIFLGGMLLGTTWLTDWLWLLALTVSARGCDGGRCTVVSVSSKVLRGQGRCKVTRVVAEEWCYLYSGRSQSPTSCKKVEVPTVLAQDPHVGALGVSLVGRAVEPTCSSNWMHVAWLRHGHGARKRSSTRTASRLQICCCKQHELSVGIR